MPCGDKDNEVCEIKILDHGGATIQSNDSAQSNEKENISFRNCCDKHQIVDQPKSECKASKVLGMDFFHLCEDSDEETELDPPDSTYVNENHPKTRCKASEVLGTDYFYLAENSNKEPELTKLDPPHTIYVNENHRKAKFKAYTVLGIQSLNLLDEDNSEETDLEELDPPDTAYVNENQESENTLLYSKNEVDRTKCKEPKFCKLLGVKSVYNMREGKDEEPDLDFFDPPDTIFIENKKKANALLYFKNEEDDNIFELDHSDYNACHIVKGGNPFLNLEDENEDYKALGPDFCEDDPKKAFLEKQTPIFSEDEEIDYRAISPIAKCKAYKVPGNESLYLDEDNNEETELEELDPPDTAYVNENQEPENTILYSINEVDRTKAKCKEPKFCELLGVKSVYNMCEEGNDEEDSFDPPDSIFIENKKNANALLYFKNEEEDNTFELNHSDYNAYHIVKRGNPFLHLEDENEDYKVLDFCNDDAVKAFSKKQTRIFSEDEDIDYRALPSCQHKKPSPIFSEDEDIDYNNLGRPIVMYRKRYSLSIVDKRL